MNNENISSIDFGIIQRLQETITNANSESINDIKKSVVYNIQPQKIRQQLNMTQSQFAKAFGIPIRTLQGWEQGRRKIDMTTASYLRIIAKFFNEIQNALAN